MKLRKWALGLWTLSLVVGAQPLWGQWVTEEIPLKAGWNAVYLHVDSSHVTLNEAIGLDDSNPIEEIWMWVPPGPTLQFFDTFQSPQAGSTEWLRWDRYWAGASPLQRLVGNVACLVRVADGAADYTWTVTGKPMAPRYEWTSSGMNLIGFTVPRDQPPTWGNFLGPVRSLHDFAEIYRYVGGPFSSTNPQRLFSSLLRNVLMERNHAYWVRSEEYNRYFGPFELELEQPAGIEFGDQRGQFRMRLSNRIEETVTVRAELVASAAPPAGQPPISGQVPLLLRGEQDLSDLSYGFSRFSETGGEWVLAPAGEPGSNIEVVVGLDRSLMSGAAGDVFAGILRFTDAGGMAMVDLPVTAEVADTTGLWVGNAVVAEVAHYLVDYAPGEDGQPEQNPDGSYRIENIDESFGPVARPFPLRLIIHSDGTGTTRLLQRVYNGANEAGEVILARSESALDPLNLEEARRVSVAHLPWSADNPGWEFDGPLGSGSPITAEVTVAYDDLSTNPFLHTFHPDHDNLDARFEDQLPRGIESFDIVRRMTLQVQPPGGDFNGVTTTSRSLSGTYEETVILQGRLTDSGSHSRTFRSRGGFSLTRASSITQLAE